MRTAEDIIRHLQEHRSIRSYTDQIPEDHIIQTIFESAIRASNTGNMQLYSFILTRDPDRKAALAPYHFKQPMVTQAPLVVTICADIHRFHRWCELNQAEPAYDNLLWFVSASIDAMLAAQNLSIAAEAYGLGLCYLGTTSFFTREIAECLGCPKGVAPITTITLGYPDKEIPLTDRLPLAACLHYEQYRKESDTELLAHFKAKEASELSQKLMAENQLPNLAQIFTKKRYKKEDNLAFSRKLLEDLSYLGFTNQ